MSDATSVADSYAYAYAKWPITITIAASGLDHVGLAAATSVIIVTKSGEQIVLVIKENAFILLRHSYFTLMFR
jgi:hypothetical protein